MNKQYRYALSYDLGYSTENILNLELKGNDVDVLKNEIAQLSDVEDVSTSLIVTSIGDTWGDRIKYKDPSDSIIIHYNSVDNKYLPLHEHKLVAGSNFTRPYLSNDSLPYEIIVSKSLLDYFDIEGPEAALGEIFTFRGRQAEVIGVINDFQYTTINNISRPFVFRNYTKNQVNYLNIKINSTDQFATRDKVEAIWKKIDDVQPIEASFYNDDIEEIYTEYAVIVKIIGYLAFLAITIALLGLLGMVIFTTETRLREIGIRKVLGATEGNLVYLMGRGFMFLLLISAVVAIPATYLLFDTVVFAEFVNRAGIGFVEIFGGTLLVFIIAVLTISSHTIRAARINPSVTLRNE